MKNFKFIPLYSIMIVSLLAASCAKKDDSSKPASSAPMSATINGISWSAASVTGKNKTGDVEVAGTAADGSEMGIKMATTTPGTYTVDAQNYAILYAKNASTNYVATSGTIVITSFSGGVMKGTFSGNAPNLTNQTDVSTITSGSFTVTF